MSLRTVVIDPPQVFTYAEKRLTGLVIRKVAGVVGMWAEWEAPGASGALELQTVKVTQSVTDLWIAKPEFGVFVDAIRDDTQ